MKKVRFVFYIAKFEWRNFLKGRKIRLVDDGISLWTGLFNWWTPKYSHMSVWKQEGRSRFRICPLVAKEGVIVTAPAFTGTCYTSTMRGDDNGTVKRPASEVFRDPRRWEYIEFQVTDESFEEAKTWADDRVAMKWSYSKRDLLRFAMPLWMLKGLKLADPDREICSEHGEGWAIRLKHKYFPETHRIEKACPLLDKILIRSPRRLWRDLVRREQVPTYSLATGKMVRDSDGKKAPFVSWRKGSEGM